MTAEERTMDPVGPEPNVEDLGEVALVRADMQLANNYGLLEDVRMDRGVSSHGRNESALETALEQSCDIIKELEIRLRDERARGHGDILHAIAELDTKFESNFAGKTWVETKSFGKALSDLVSISVDGQMLPDTRQKLVNTTIALLKLMGE